MSDTDIREETDVDQEADSSFESAKGISPEEELDYILDHRDSYI